MLGLLLTVYIGATREKKDARMSDRHNTIVCCFDPRSPRITAFHIHE